MKYLCALSILLFSSVFSMSYFGEETSHHMIDNMPNINLAEHAYNKQTLQAFHCDQHGDCAFIRCCLPNAAFRDIQINVPDHITLGQAIQHIQLRTALIEVSDDLLQRIDNVEAAADTINKINQLNIALNTPLNTPLIFQGNQIYPNMLRQLVAAVNNGGYDMFLSRLLFLIKNNVGLLIAFANIPNNTQYIILHVCLQNRVSKNMKELMLNSSANHLFNDIFYNTFREQISLIGFQGSSATVVSYSTIE